MNKNRIFVRKHANRAGYRAGGLKGERLNMKKYAPLLCWTGIFGMLFVFLQYGYKFHFYFYEQNYLFLFSGDYARATLAQTGGLCAYLAAFLAQFFIYPYAGAAVTAALLTAVGILAGLLVKTVSPDNRSALLSLLPPAALLFVHFDFNYRLQGTVAYLLALAALYGYARIRKPGKRLIAGVCLVAVLYIAAGPVTLLFAVTAVLWERMRPGKFPFPVFILPLLAAVIAFVTVYFAFAGEFRFVFLPDAYYQAKLQPGAVLYLSWALLPCILAAAFYTGRKRLSSKGKYMWYGIQLLLLGALLYRGVPHYSDRKSMKMKELDYYARTAQWERMEQACRGRQTNYLYLNYLNLALSSREKLAAEAFAFDQKGPLGLQVNWNKTAHVSTLSSDIYWSIGAVALSQEMAFEGFVGQPNPRLLKRLVQTNLVYGYYAVAEKYLSMLEKTVYYRKWAAAQRAFLYNDAALEADSLLGGKRRCLPAINSLALSNGIDTELRRIAESNPRHRATIQFLGLVHLAGKDLETFRPLVEKYYGTEVLPALPASFQEAVIVYSENDPAYWERHGVSDATVRRYRAYKKLLLQNRGRSNVRAVMAQSFGNTFWYYLMFK